MCHRQYSPFIIYLLLNATLNNLALNRECKSNVLSPQKDQTCQSCVQLLVVKRYKRRRYLLGWIY